MVGWRQLAKLGRLVQTLDDFRTFKWIHRKTFNEVEMRKLNKVEEILQKRVSKQKQQIINSMSDNFQPYFIRFTVECIDEMHRYKSDQIYEATLLMLVSLNNELYQRLVELFCGLAKLHTLSANIRYPNDEVKIEFTVSEVKSIISPLLCEFKLLLCDEYDNIHSIESKEELKWEWGVELTNIPYWFGIELTRWLTYYSFTHYEIETTRTLEDFEGQFRWYILHNPTIPPHFEKIEDSVFGTIFVNPSKDTLILYDYKTEIAITNDKTLATLYESCVV